MVTNFLMMALLPFALCWGLLKILLNPRFSRWVIDRPNGRSLHSVPVPRTGGLAIVGAVLAAWWINDPSGLQPLVTGMAVLAALSFADDVRGLPVAWRFLGHGAVAVAVAWWILPAAPIWLHAIMVLVLIWMTNLYNFMDGSDGLAGGMGLFGFGSYALAAWLDGDVAMAHIGLALAAAAGAFLICNFPPARIFMGDAGSIPLGFLAAALGLLGWQRGDWPLWFPVLVFSPFIVDATVTLLRRLFRGEKIWQAHRSHYYQRLVQMGWGHRKTALWEYGLMLLAGGSAVWLTRQPVTTQGLGLGAWVGVFVLLLVMVDRMWQKERQ